MKNIRINNSYCIWNTKQMRTLIADEAKSKYHTDFPEVLLNRLFYDMYIEWWLHNIGYYVSLPLKKWKFWHEINLRCKDVDLEEWQ